MSLSFFFCWGQVCQHHDTAFVYLLTYNKQIGIIILLLILALNPLNPIHELYSFYLVITHEENLS